MARLQQVKSAIQVDESTDVASAASVGLRSILLSRRSVRRFCFERHFPMLFTLSFHSLNWHGHSALAVQPL